MKGFEECFEAVGRPGPCLRADAARGSIGRAKKVTLRETLI
jgi:hypothetical protein